MIHQEPIATSTACANEQRGLHSGFTHFVMLWHFVKEYIPFGKKCLNICYGSENQYFFPTTEVHLQYVTP